jgi:Biotin carboxylase, N-terminal domain/Carbamoyl-phosphate synthase L chain, ATP binding domain
MSSTLLIANRGEIALRIIRTATELGIQTVAVYAEDDADSPHVHAADEAIRVPDYLDQAAILAAAKESGAELIHPGYGFLSENAEFARACVAAGYTFVGPDADALDTVGNKSAARAAALASGLPVLAATEGPSSLDDVREFFTAQDGAIMIKALAGGGGRGMRKVDQGDQVDLLESAYRQCAAEAQLGFGDPAVFAEAHLPAARHIEVQIVAAPAGFQTHALALGIRRSSKSHLPRVFRPHCGVNYTRARPGFAPTWACAGWPPSNSWSPVRSSFSSRSTRASRSNTRSPKRSPVSTWWLSSWPSPAVRPTISCGCPPESPLTEAKSSASPPRDAASRFRPGSTWRPLPPTDPSYRHPAP